MLRPFKKHFTSKKVYKHVRSILKHRIRQRASRFFDLESMCIGKNYSDEKEEGLNEYDLEDDFIDNSEVVESPISFYWRFNTY